MTGGLFAGRPGLSLLALLTGIFLFNFLARITLAPLMPLIETELGLDHAAAGGLFTLLAIGYSAGLLGSGFVSARLNHRRTIVLAAIAGGAVLLMIAANDDLWTIRVGLVFLGLFTGIYLPSGMTTISNAFPPVHWGKAFAVHELAPAIAYMTAPLIVEAILLFSPWRGVIAMIGSVSVLLGLAFWRLSPDDRSAGEPPSAGNIRLLFAKPAFWIMTVLFGLAIGSSIGLYSMIPLFLIAERGFDREAANALVGASRLPVVAMALASGWISDRFGPKPTVAAAILFTGLTTILLGILPGRWVILTMFLQPMLMVCFFPAAFTILSRIVPPGARNLSVSLTVFVAYLLGAALIPPLLGFFGDHGAFGAAFTLIGGMMVLSVLMLKRLEVGELRGHNT